MSAHMMSQQYFCLSSDEEEEEGDGLEILMEAPEGFRNSDEDCCSDSQVKPLIKLLIFHCFNV